MMLDQNDNVKNSNVGMVCYGPPHPSHKGFAEAVGADIIKIKRGDPNSIKSIIHELMNGVRIDDYDILIAEGSRPLYATMANNVVRETPVIYLCADHRFYELLNSELKIGSVYSIVKSIGGKFGKSAIKFLCRNRISGVIAVSEFASQFIQPVVGEKTPVKISHPYIQSDKYTSLGQVEPSLGKDTAVTVSYSSHYKGVDLLVKAWSNIVSEFPEATLHIVGKGHPSSYEDTDGVVVHGFVDNLENIFSESSLYIQPSRMDAFGVSVLEGYRAGLPAVVTETTGSKSEVQKIDPSMIVSTECKDIEQAVKRYFDMDLSSRNELSSSVRQRSKRFNEQTQTKSFVSSFESVVSEIR